jgi:hypothetical protein
MKSTVNINRSTHTRLIHIRSMNKIWINTWNTHTGFGLISELELLVVPNFTLDVRSRFVVDWSCFSLWLRVACGTQFHLDLGFLLLIDPVFNFDWEWLVVPNFTSIWVFCCCCLCPGSHFDVGCIYCVFWLALILFGSMYWCFVPFLFLYGWFLRFFRVCYWCCRISSIVKSLYGLVLHIVLVLYLVHY